MAELAQEEFLDALSAVVRARRATLLRIAARQGLVAEDALESVQDALCTFLRMHREGELQAPPSEWSALLTGIVRNAARNKRRLHALSRPHDAQAADQQHSDAPAADELLIREKQRRRLRVCVAELCERQRAVILLRLLDEQPGEDVAQSLGLTRSYVDVLTHRAKASLRACMLRERSV